MAKGGCLLALAGLIVASDCGTGGSQAGATCNSVCNNVVSKCAPTDQNVASNSCLETCLTDTMSLPATCATAEANMLSCLTSSEAIDCGDVFSSTLCASEAAALTCCKTPAPVSIPSTNSVTLTPTSLTSTFTGALVVPRSGDDFTTRTVELLPLPRVFGRT
jgi:hypothetical protein